MNQTSKNTENLSTTGKRKLRICQHCTHSQLSRTPKSEPFCCGDCKKYSK